MLARVSVVLVLCYIIIPCAYTGKPQLFLMVKCATGYPNYVFFAM